MPEPIEVRIRPQVVLWSVLDSYAFFVEYCDEKGWQRHHRIEDTTTPEQALAFLEANRDRFTSVKLINV